MMALNLPKQTNGQTQFQPVSIEQSFQMTSKFFSFSSHSQNEHVLQISFLRMLQRFESFINCFITLASKEILLLAFKVIISNQKWKDCQSMETQICLKLILWGIQFGNFVLKVTVTSVYEDVDLLLILLAGALQKTLQV